MKFLAFCFLLLSTLSFADQYIAGVQRVTFRTGPGTDNKIIKMLPTDERVTLIEEGETWSKVKDQEGEEGYVLTRFLSKEVPAIIKFNYIKRKYEALKEKHEGLTSKSSETKSELSQVEEKLQTAQDELKKMQNEYEQLKAGSADYIGLKSRFEKVTSELESKTQRVKNLESKVNVYYIKWFLAAGGVLLLGWLIGLISRKKRNYPTLRL